MRKINDLDLQKWRELSHLNTSSLWQIDRDATWEDKDGFLGRCVLQIPLQLIERYTRRGEIVLDPFIGTGTTAEACEQLGRRCVGIDLDTKQLSARFQRFQPADVWSPSTEPFFLEGDSADAAMRDDVEFWMRFQYGHAQVHFLLLHPPYWNIVRFSQDRRDLSNFQTLAGFLEALRVTLTWTWELLAPGRWAAVVVGDLYQQGRYLPLSHQVFALMEETGYTPKGIVTKNITGNERGKGYRQNLWRYRALKDGFFTLDTERVLVFQKPP